MLDILRDPVGFEIIDLHEDDAMQVRALVGSTRMGNLEEMPGDPDFKCYVPGPAGPMARVVWKAAAPLIWLTPKKPVYAGEAYDFSLRSPMHNGSCLSDEKNQPVSPLELKKRHPELSHFFQLPSLKNLVDQSPNLGLKFNLEQFAAARNQAWQTFRMRMDRRFNDPTEAYIVAGDCSFRYLRLIDFEHRHITWSPDFLQRDLLDGASILLADIGSSMSDDQFDQEGSRYQTIGHKTKSWLDQRRCMRFIERSDGQERAQLASMVITQVLTEIMIEELDLSIMETMR